MKVSSTMAAICMTAALAASPAHAQNGNIQPLNGDIPSVTKEVRMPANASPESQSSLQEGREQAKRHHHAKPPRQQQEIKDHSTGLENRVDAGEGAIGGAAMADPAAMGSGARMTTPFNR